MSIIHMKWYVRLVVTFYIFVVTNMAAARDCSLATPTVLIAGQASNGQLGGDSRPQEGRASSMTVHDGKGCPRERGRECNWLGSCLKAHPACACAHTRYTLSLWHSRRSGPLRWSLWILTTSSSAVMAPTSEITSASCSDSTTDKEERLRHVCEDCKRWRFLRLAPQCFAFTNIKSYPYVRS